MNAMTEPLLFKQGDRELVRFQTHPTKYQHWTLSVEGDVARLKLNINEDGGIKPGYKLKLNSYDLGVDIELNDAVNRIRFEHPEVRTVVVTSAKEKVFCSGANIFMLGLSTHGWKVNFCKFTNETRNGLEDSSQYSGLKFLAAVNGACAGGGYELALACDEIILVDDRSSAVSLPEVPLLGVLPGTGGLTRVTDKRKVRHDLADIFCTTTEGVRGQKAKDWRLVDDIAKPAQFAAKVQERALQLAADSDRPANAKGVALPRLARVDEADALRYQHVTVEIDRAKRTAVFTVQGPTGAQPIDVAAIEAAGAAWYPLQMGRELEDAILQMRTNELDIGLWLMKTEGDAAAVLARAARRLQPRLVAVQRLNTAMSDELLGGSTANADKLIPLCFGEVHNITPLLADPGDLEYKVHTGPIEAIVETRDYGVPVGTTDDISTASYELDNSPVGQVTNSVQGDKDGGIYCNTVASLVRRIATGFGANPLDDATEIDDDSFDDFDAANDQVVGLYCSDRMNVLAACQQLAASVGAQVLMSATGKLRIIKIELPPPGTPVEVSEDQIDERGDISILQRLPVQAAVKLGYNRNYTLQPSLQTGIPAEHKDLYTQEWLTVSASSPTLVTAYKVSGAPIQQDTLLQVTSEAQAEADRRLALWGAQRCIYAYTGLGSQLMLELGQGVTLPTDSRFEVGGTTGQVVGLAKDWINGTVRVEVLA